MSIKKVHVHYNAKGDKMKKKLLLAMLTVACLGGGALGATACQPANAYKLNYEVNGETAYFKDVEGTPGEGTEIEISAEYNGKPVTKIGKDAFRQKGKGITRIIIPDSVTEIGENAFSYCYFTGITLPANLTTIGEGAFRNCESLTSIKLPDKLTSLGAVGGGVFRDCKSLTTVTVPAGVTTIPEYTFDGCTALTSVTLSGKVTYIGQNAFSRCVNLTSFVIPDGVTELDDWTFQGCTKLKSVTIPASVTKIDYKAFQNCTALTSVTYKGTVAEWNNLRLSNFTDGASAYTVTCTDGTVEVSKG